MVMGITTATDRAKPADGLHPVNLRTDLGELADLIELVFADTMDENGRAAIREMRYLSHLGPGLALMSRLNDMMVGISMGYVWREDGHLVGNVSIYPAQWHKSLGKAWMIANVGVHPRYRGRGIARQLMSASLDAIRRRQGTHAILQVDYDNIAAINLYETLNFMRERAFTMWTRSALLAPPPLSTDSVAFHITRPRGADWRAEYRLAQDVRPNDLGGIGWMKPVYPGLFRPSLLSQLKNLLSLGTREHLIIRSQDQSEILSSIWVEQGFAMTRTRLALMTQPGHVVPEGEAILNSVLRRFHMNGFVLEHPHDDPQAAELFQRQRFIPMRTVWHMRLNL